MLFLVLCTGIVSFDIPCTRVLLFVMFRAGCICSVALFAMEVIFGTCFAANVFFVMTLVVAHLCVLPLLEITFHSDSYQQLTCPEQLQETERARA
jgi:hypothetical protein